MIQFDFARDVATFLHRIGRTARASSFGIGISFITSENELLVKAIEAHLADDEALAGSFSRRRSLRRTYRKGQKQLLLELQEPTQDTQE